MNPENVGEQIMLRHSSLWRKPLQYEKPIPQTVGCHKQLNELGATGISWTSRNNFIQTHSSKLRNKSGLTKKTTSKNLNELLKEQDKQSNLARSMVKSLIPHAEALDRSKKLVEGMQDLRKMNLLTGKDLQKVKFPGVIRHHHVHNDYHMRETNPGFSRNYQGKFYTK